LTTTTVECKKSSASEAPDPGRHHVGTPGDIIAECPGDFVGIRNEVRSTDACRQVRRLAEDLLRSAASWRLTVISGKCRFGLTLRRCVMAAAAAGIVIVGPVRAGSRDD
jgi:hypothetical protein